MFTLSKASLPGVAEVFDLGYQTVMLHVESQLTQLKTKWPTWLIDLNERRQTVLTLIETKWIATRKRCLIISIVNKSPAETTTTSTTTVYPPTTHQIGDFKYW